MMVEGSREADFKLSMRFVVVIFSRFDVRLRKSVSAKCFEIRIAQVLLDVQVVLLRVYSCVLLIGG
jgi:hypothetical protein